MKRLYKLSIKKLACLPQDAFSFVLNDMKSVDQSGLVSIECGPTITGPLYAFDRVKNVPLFKNPVDTLYLSRYTGPVREDALGPRFSSVSEILATFKLASTFSEASEDGQGGQWAFEQWNRLQ